MDRVRLSQLTPAEDVENHQHRYGRSIPKSHYSKVERLTDLNPNWQINNDPLLIYDVLAIREQMVNVLLVLVGEENFEPLWGSLVTRRVFDPASKRAVVNNYRLESDVIYALHQFMKDRIVVLHGTSFVEQADEINDEEASEGWIVHIEWYPVDAADMVDAFDFLLLRGMSSTVRTRLL